MDCMDFLRLHNHGCCCPEKGGQLRSTKGGVSYCLINFTAAVA
jgi:hypothetical protein